MNNTLYIIMPAYNEEAIIQKVIEEWYPVLKLDEVSPDSRICVIDDGSKDKTGKVLDELSKVFKQLIVVHKPNGGHGSAVIEGYKTAITMHADYVFQTDSDGQTNPKEFEKFWRKRELYDAIFGNRNNRQDGTSRKFVEKTLCMLLFAFFHVKVPDSNAPFRLFSINTLKEYIDILPSPCQTPNVFLTTGYVYDKKQVKFIPVSFGTRTTGKNSINMKRIFKIGIETIKQFSFFKHKLKEKKNANL